MQKLLIDFSQLCFSTYYIKISNEMQTDWDFWRFLVLQSLRKLKKDFMIGKDDQIILCCDSRSWRKDFYSEYKANREYDENIREMFEEVNKFIDELKEVFPYIILRVNGAEADDIIAILTFSNNYENDNIYIISSDKDFVQLFRYNKNIILYNPIREELREPDKYKDYYIYHILKGDSGDNVPSVVNKISYSGNFVSFLKKQPEFKNFIKSYSAKELNEKYNPVQKFIDFKIFDFKNEFSDIYDNYIKMFETDTGKAVFSPGGDKKVESIISYDLKKWYQQQPKYIQEMLKVNEKLVMLNEHTIPKTVIDDVLTQYSTYSENKIDYDRINAYLKSKRIKTILATEIR